jgi:hypothetical protein
MISVRHRPLQLQAVGRSVRLEVVIVIEGPHRFGGASRLRVEGDV